MLRTKIPRCLVLVAGMVVIQFCLSGVLADDKTPPPNKPGDSKSALIEARHLLLTGKYAEAIDTFTPLIETEPAAVLGLAVSHRATGKVKEATDVLTKGNTRFGKNAEIPAQLAKLDFELGTAEVSPERIAEILKLNQDNLTAHWIEAELHRRAGRLKEAEAGYRWFVDYYNAHPNVKSADELHCIGLAAGQYARWKRLHEQFGFLVNELFPDCLKLDQDYWPAHYEAGKLYLEKYNQAEASKEFKVALAINPNAAEIHAALAELALQGYDLAEAKLHTDRALAINPQLIEAHLLRAKTHLANFEAAEAIKVLKNGPPGLLKFDEGRGLLAAAYFAVDGHPEKPEEGKQEQGRGGNLIAETNARNPHAGEFYLSLASGLDTVRKFPAASKYYAEATKRTPQLTAARSELGLMQMRLGQEVEAEKILKEAFDIDPFNVRVSNTLKVLDVLSGYAIIETDHFVIKFDRGRDELLAKYAARYLEDEVYPDLTKKLGYIPAEKSLFEIFSRAKNTDGHGWFSARMVGLPYIGTVGACAGKMVALTSPNDTKQKFNWARVLKHEFVHVLNLQQTNFNIPHWYTEALAVYNEGYARPRDWTILLAERQRANKLFNLETINLGFIRPHSSQDWTLAYCQAELYAEYMVEKYGEDALAKMLKAYADNLTTRAALKHCFQVEQDDFEKGYGKFLEKIIAGAGEEGGKKTDADFATLVKQHEAAPDDADISAKLALEYIRRKSLPQARELVAPILKKNPQHQLAAYVMGRLKMSIGEDDEAISLMEKALDKTAPQENLLALLAAIQMKAEKYDAAAELYELGAQHEPHNPQWTQSLARVYLLAKNNDKLVPILTKLAEADADDATVRKKLAQLAFDRKDFAAASKWATHALYIDIQDGPSHKIMALVLTEKKAWSPAFAEFEAAVELLPQDTSLRYTWAEACIAAEKPDQAKTILEKLLVLDPENAAAKSLLDTLKK